MERVRIDAKACRDVEIVERSLYRIIGDLAEALERTPPTISSKPLIEGALKLAMGAYNSIYRLKTLCSQGTPAPLNQ
ncbi:MAG: hypothetical protein F7B17_05345 [Desulfurococcales archaeon]|nr:hypothetical protein [Desulfurococcales archaeon]